MYLVKSISTEIKLTSYTEWDLSEHEVYSPVTQKDKGTLSGKDKNEK